MYLSCKRIIVFEREEKVWKKYTVFNEFFQTEDNSSHLTIKWFSKNVRNKYFLSVISQGPLCCDEIVKTPGFLGRANFPNFPHLKAAVVSFMFKSFLCSP